MSKNDFNTQPFIPPSVRRIIEGTTIINGEVRPESSVRRTFGGRIMIDDISLKEKYESDIKSLQELCDEKSKAITMLHEDRRDLVNRIDELESGEASLTCEIDHALGHAMAVHKKFPDFDIEVFKNGKLLVGIRTNSMNCMIINL